MRIDIAIHESFSNPADLAGFVTDLRAIFDRYSAAPKVAPASVAIDVPAAALPAFEGEANAAAAEYVEAPAEAPRTRKPRQSRSAAPNPHHVPVAPPTTEPVSAPAAAPEAPPVPKPAAGATLEDVCAAVNAADMAGASDDDFLAVFAQLGADKVSKIAPERFGDAVRLFGDLARKYGKG